MAPGDIAARVRALTESMLVELTDFRRDLHAHPELGHEEKRTTAQVAEKLAAFGLEPRLLPGSGALCEVRPGLLPSSAGGGPEKIIGLRADLDALPLPDMCGHEWKSTIEGRAHACGHDVHTTCVLGAGLVLSRLAAEGLLPAPVRLIFQPAEEVQPSGSLDVIKEGGIDGLTSIFALHCDPHYDVGTIATRPGSITSACDMLTIHILGDGGHTSRPHLTQDVVFATGQLITQLPAVLSRRIDPRAGVNLTWGAVHSGSIHNAIPTSAILEGTLRALDVEAWEQAGGLIQDTIKQICAPYQVRLGINHVRGVPPVVDDRKAAETVSDAGRAILGPDNVEVAEQSLGGEDFAWYLMKKVPGALFRLGTRTPGGHTYDIHQSDFDVDEGAIAVGIETLTMTALLAAE